MPKPYRASLTKRPYAVVLIEWQPRVRPLRDFARFDSVDAMQEHFGTWCEHSEGADHPIVVAEVVDTAAMALGRIAAFGDDAERRADMIQAEPDRLIANRENKARANISWITGTLATGGDFAYLDDVMAQQRDDLLAQNISLIVDCRVEDSDSDIWQAVATERDDVPDYLHLPTDDADGWNIPPDHFDAAVGAARARIDQGHRVFVHCHMGVNRGPSTAYAVLLAQGYGITEAFDMIRAARPIAGIAYAEDALIWWAHRQGWQETQRDSAVAALNAHINLVLGPKEGRIIERAVREAALVDQRDSAEILW